MRVPSIYIAVLILCAATRGNAQDQFQQQTTQAQVPKTTVTGTVVNAVTGEPIRRAMVQLFSQQVISVLTGADGRFEMTGVPESSVSINANKPGYFDSRFMGDQTGQNSSFTVGSGTNDFTLKLFPAAKITGRITEEGEPIEGVPVMVLTEQIVDGRRRWSSGMQSVTDDDGVYRLDNLAPGSCAIEVLGRSLPRETWNAPLQVIAPVYYPSSGDAASAQHVSLKAGEQFQADFQLRSVRGYRVSGTVTGLPAGAGLSTSLLDESGQEVLGQNVQVDQQRGRFTIEGIPAGSWTLRMSASHNLSNGPPQSFEARQEFSVTSSDLANLRLVLLPQVSIPVTVRHSTGENGQPEAGQWLNVRLISSDGEGNVQPMMNTMSKDGSGSAQFPAVPPGKYTLDVLSGGNECLESAWAGDTDLTREYLVIQPGGQPPSITLTMTGNCATFAPEFDTDDKAPQMASVVLVASSKVAEPRVIPVQTSGQNPAMLLSPGSYDVYAFTSLSNLAYGEPETMRQYSSQSIDAQPNQKLQVKLKIINPQAN